MPSSVDTRGEKRELRVGLSNEIMGQRTEQLVNEEIRNSILNDDCSTVCAGETTKRPNLFLSSSPETCWLGARRLGSPTLRPQIGWLGG